MIIQTSISARASCESQPSLRASNRRLRAFFSFVVASSRASRRRSHPPLSADTNTKRETGRTAQLNNIAAAKVRVEREERLPRARRSTFVVARRPSIIFSTSFDRLRFCRLREISSRSSRRPRRTPRPPSRSQAVADVIRTTLGPRSMLKIILDASGGASSPPATRSRPSPRAPIRDDGRRRRLARGLFPRDRSRAVRHRSLTAAVPFRSPPLLPTSSGIVLTNDGNAILREIDVTHPAAKVRVPPSARIARRAQTTDRPFLNVVARSTNDVQNRKKSIVRSIVLSIDRSFVRSFDRSSSLVLRNRPLTASPPPTTATRFDSP